MSWFDLTTGEQRGAVIACGFSAGGRPGAAKLLPVDRARLSKESLSLSSTSSGITLPSLILALSSRSCESRHDPAGANPSANSLS